jgi:hypothetical protein
VGEIAQAMGALLRRADTLAGGAEGSDAENELNAIAVVVEPYEAKRWHDGKEPGGRAEWSLMVAPCLTWHATVT